MSYPNAVAETVDKWFLQEYGKHIITQAGKVDIRTLINTVGLRCTADKLKKYNVEVDISQNTSDEFSILQDQNTLVMCVPQYLREQIQLATDYLFVQFDKLQVAVADVTKEFQLNRKGVIVNAEKELRNLRYDFSNDSRHIILNCISNVGNAIEQIQESILAVCERVNSIPQNRLKRLFSNVPTVKILADVQNARYSVYDYVFGSVLYAELNLKVGRLDNAIERMQDAASFLKEMRDNNLFLRMEQWNEKMDLFWEDGIDQQIDTLAKQLSIMHNYSGKVLLKEGTLV